MAPPPPAELGMPLEEVDTPALLVDLDVLERNLRRMADSLRGLPVRLRPHAKSHKCPEIARRQMALGAVGVCCQKVSEAEVLVEGGVTDVLVSNEVVGRRKLERLAALARRARVAVCVDDAGNVDELDAAARRAGVNLEVLVEIDVGAGRCGTPPGPPALALAQRVRAREHLRFAGLQAYQGAAQHLREGAARRAAIDAAVGHVRATVGLLENHGIPCPWITGGGTGTYLLEAASGTYREVQPGSYVFMDADYARNLEAPEASPPFELSLFVLATVMSRPAASRAVVDAGLKAFSVDSGLPLVYGRPNIVYTRAMDEHGVLEPAPGTRLPALGEKLLLVPGHCDPTVNLHDWYVAVRGGRVEALWPITARGAVW
jgi:3-hydroxy-D-aspartate aldolase